VSGQDTKPDANVLSLADARRRAAEAPATPDAEAPAPGAPGHLDLEAAAREAAARKERERRERMRRTQALASQLRRTPRRDGD
jgi:hypothetical protein